MTPTSPARWRPDARLRSRACIPPPAAPGSNFVPATCCSRRCGFAAIRLRFDVETDAPPDKLDALLKLTERYCVVYQTLKSGPPIEVKLNRA